MVKSLLEMENSHSKSITGIEAHLKQIANILNEEELQSKPVANPNGHHEEDESTSYHEQAITTLRSEEVVENQVEERKDEQIEILRDLQ